MLAQLIIIITCIVIIFKLVIIFILAFVNQRVKSGLQNCNGYPGLLMLSAELTNRAKRSRLILKVNKIIVV